MSEVKLRLVRVIRVMKVISSRRCVFIKRLTAITPGYRVTRRIIRVIRVIRVIEGVELRRTPHIRHLITLITTTHVRDRRTYFLMVPTLPIFMSGLVCCPNIRVIKVIMIIRVICDRI